jgi:hypothetical protein
LSSAPTLAILLLSQGCKLLHLFGVETSLCVSAAYLLISLLLPFVRLFSSGWVSSRAADSSNSDPLDSVVWKPTLSLYEVISYPLGATISCYIASNKLFPSIFTLLGDQHSTVTQSSFSAAALWFFFAAFFVLVYWRSASLLRRSC